MCFWIHMDLFFCVVSVFLCAVCISWIVMLEGFVKVSTKREREWWRLLYATLKPCFDVLARQNMKSPGSGERGRVITLSHLTEASRSLNFPFVFLSVCCLSLFVSLLICCCLSLLPLCAPSIGGDKDKTLMRRKITLITEPPHSWKPPDIYTVIYCNIKELHNRQSLMIIGWTQLTLQVPVFGRNFHCFFVVCSLLWYEKSVRLITNWVILKFIHVFSWKY